VVEAYLDHMSARTRMILGIVLFLVGAVWTLQGVGVLGGSAMSGKALWAIIGPVVALAGLALAIPSRRAR
jgi:hypothetical protein